MSVRHVLLTALCVISTPFVSAKPPATISIEKPYVRMAPPGAKTTAAFMQINNNGDSNLQLLTASSPAAAAVEIHNHINDQGVMRMRRVEAIDIPAHGSAHLQPGGYHLMLIDMQRELHEGDKIAITLGFDNGRSKTIKVPVLNIMQGMRMSHDMEHNMQHGMDSGMKPPKLPAH